MSSCDHRMIDLRGENILYMDYSDSDSRSDSDSNSDDGWD